jgi:hypothetical protein
MPGVFRFDAAAACGSVSQRRTCGAIVEMPRDVVYCYRNVKLTNTGINDILHAVAGERRKIHKSAAKMNCGS